MRLDDFVKEYRLPKHDLSCSEATLRAANEAYALGLDEKALSMMAGFSGGLMREDLCGAITGAIATLSALYTHEVAHQSPLLKEAIRAYLQKVDDYFGSTNCACIKSTHRDENGEGCNPVIYENARLLDEVVEVFDEISKENQKNV